MDSHGIRTEHAATPVNSGGIMFDDNFYDREVDVLYLHVGEPSTAVDFDGTAAGDATRYGPDGRLVGLTILSARSRLEKDGRIELTLPEQHLENRVRSDRPHLTRLGHVRYRHYRVVH